MSAALASSLWSQLAGPERAAVIGRPEDGRLAHEFAALLQRDFAGSGCQSGEMIGTLADIRQRYGLGRWACREAVGILELRGWLESRRGAGGGLVLTLPTIRDLAKLTLLHLCLKGLGVDQVIEVRWAVYRAVVRRLLMRASAEAPAKPLGCAIGFQSSGGCHTATRQFSSWLADHTGNRALGFLMEFVSALYAECGEPPAKESVAQQTLLWTAIRSGDEARATAALDAFLQSTERLRAGDAVALPEVFSRDGACSSATHSARLAQRLLRDIAQRTRTGRTELETEAAIGERHCLNRDIVRRAIRMLEDIGVVVPRRGRQGGLQRREPDLAIIIELMPPLLARYDVSPAEAIDATLFLKLEAARLAAARVRTAAASSKVAALAEKLMSTVPTQPHELIMMENSLIDLTENEVLAACDRGLMFFGPVFSPEQIDPTGAGASRAIANTLEMTEAIRAGDVHRAEVACLRKMFDLRMSHRPEYRGESGPANS
jgi:DNA-binding FadR family transcriptional regulator